MGHVAFHVMETLARFTKQEFLASRKKAQQVDYEEDQQDGAESDTGAATITPAAMAIISAATAQNQQQ